MEKRKAKKGRKAGEKAEVRELLLRALLSLKSQQLSPPRFFYVNSEIIRRREGVTIGVRQSILVF